MANYDQRKSELIAELDRARSRASAHRQQIQGTKQRATSKTRATIARNRYGWIVGAVVLGFIIAKLPARTKKVVVERKGQRTAEANLANAGKAGIGLALLKIAIDVAKPVMMAWLTKRLGEAVHVGKEVRHKVERVDRKI
jgi:hypothetical protein